MSVVKGGLNYFTCNLAQAVKWKHENPDVELFDNVIDLVDKQAKSIPESPAIGFAQLKSRDSATSPCAYVAVTPGDAHLLTEMQHHLY